LRRRDPGAQNLLQLKTSFAPESRLKIRVFLLIPFLPESQFHAPGRKRCRAILALVQTGERGVFRLIATKRGRELNWDGGNTLERYIAHSTTLDNNRRHDVWRAATEAEITTASATSKEEKDIETLLELFNPPGKLSQAELLERAAEHKLAWNQQKISRVLEDAMKAGYIFEEAITAIRYHGPVSFRQWSARLALPAMA
jgi:hypothetical protein